jgi:predicted DsbA family dithiol-disulfide isomerase
VEPPENPLPEGVKRPGLGPRKKSHAHDDLRHWAELCGAEFSPDARKNRPDPHLLTQAFLVAKDEVVRALLAGAGLDADAALARAQSDELRERLDAESRAAVGRGVFGAPTLFVGDEMFWGNDRFELVRYYIQKSSS